MCAVAVILFAATAPVVKNALSCATELSDAAGKAVTGPAGLFFPCRIASAPLVRAPVPITRIEPEVASLNMGGP